MVRTTVSQVGLTVLVTGTTFLALGCPPEDGNGSPNDTADAGTETEVDAATFVRDRADLFAEWRCRAAFACPSEVRIPTSARASRFGNEQTCIDNFASAFGLPTQVQANRLEAEIEQGLVEFDGAPAAQCLDELRAIANDACSSSLSDLPQACRNAVTGTQSQGDPCAADRHCESNSCNEFADSFSEACYGACRAPRTTVGAGEPCGGDSGNICDPASNLVCNRRLEEPECVEPGSVEKGGSCSTPALCTGDLTCQFGTCAELTVKAEGEDCEFQESGPMKVCEPGLVCLADSVTCQPPGEQGDECFVPFDCRYGLTCEGADLAQDKPGSCVPGDKMNGASCVFNDECATGLCDNETCVDPAESICEVPAEES